MNQKKILNVFKSGNFIKKSKDRKIMTKSEDF